MATLELTIKYRPPIVSAALWAMILLSPLWFVCPFGLALIAIGIQVLHLESLASHTYLLTHFYNALPMFICSLALTAFLAERRLVLSQQGICFPPCFLASLMMRRNRAWYDLAEAALSGNKDLRKTDLILRFHSGGEARIALKKLSVFDIEQITLAIETFADPKVPKLHLSELKKEIADALKIEGVKSYTNIWESELNYRYSATTFIPLAPGRTLLNGELRVVRQLGFGGLSAIYLVQKSKKDLFILKESCVPLDVDAALKEKAEEQFQREASILAGLRHAQIAKVFDHFVEGGRQYLLLEYVHGEDLRQHVQEKGAMSEERVRRIAIEITSILQYLHGQDPPIIHRDLTPENLMLSDSNKIVLIDFGAANQFLETATGTLVGKHCYIAPEQFRGHATVQSDYYSLGGTLYFLLTGTEPVPLSQSYPRAQNAAVSEEMNQIVASLTDPDARHRISSLQVLMQMLESSDNQAGISA